jgi:glycosyltransferase involved in cell wall biosynthesis
MTTKISAFIIAKNEESRISYAIKSMRQIAEEIIVVDSGSTDNTVQICKELGAKVFFNAWPGYARQKAYAENLCKNDWILNLDADEELSQGLKDEIEYIFASNMQDIYYAYRIKLTILYRNNKPSFFAPVNKAIRLYNRNFCSFESDNASTHDSVIFKDNISTANKIYTLNEIAYHRSGASIAQLVGKANFYSSQQAMDLCKKGRKITNLRIIYEIFFAFFKAFILRRYFIFGFDGLVDSAIFAFARFLRLAKARELEQNIKK